MAADNIEVQQEPLHVLPISPGIALGPVRLLETGAGKRIREFIDATQLADERQLLQQALASAEQELDHLQQQVVQKLGPSEAEIFSAQKLMLHDPDLLDEVDELMAQQLLSAENAWQQTVQRQSADLAALEDATLAARAADVQDLGKRVLAHLQADVRREEEMKPGSQPAVIIAYDLTPSQTAGLDPAAILGLCTVEGGPTTHAAIIARALELPAVAGLDAGVLARLRNGQEVAIDGEQGLIYLHPDGERRLALQAAMQQGQAERVRKRVQNTRLWRTRGGETADGQSVLVYANVGDAEGARVAGREGAQGIGLLRTEFLFGQRPIFPDEQEQFEGYCSVFQAFAEQALFQKTIIARTLDAGADKPFPALEPLLGHWKEANPALGLRGSRIHLLHEELLRQQLRALLRAAGETSTQLHILFPMIATLEETRHLKRVLAQVRAALSSEGANIPPDIQIGLMIETPAAVWMADALAREVDFLSIGANDLFQYTLAADRTNSRVMGLFGALEPALWRAIAAVAQAGQTQGRLVAVCGEIAADPRYAPLLVGLGVRELSVSPPALARVKDALHQRSLSDWQARALAMLQAETAEEIEACISA